MQADDHAQRSDHLVPQYVTFSAHFVSTMKRRYDLQRYQTKNGTFGAKNSRKSQKSPIFDRKCSYLVTLRSGNSARNRKSPISGSG